MTSFLNDPYYIVSMAGIIFMAGSTLATNRWVHKCFERRIKRLERHNHIEEE